MTTVQIAKNIKAELKAIGVTAKTKSDAGQMTEVIWVKVADEAVKQVRELVKKFETNDLNIFVQAI